MKDRQMFALLQQLWRDLHFSEFYWVALAIVVILVFSAGCLRGCVSAKAVVCLRRMHCEPSELEA